jgi:hypothetical protein
MFCRHYAAPRSIRCISQSEPGQIILKIVVLGKLWPQTGLECRSVDNSKGRIVAFLKVDFEEYIWVSIRHQKGWASYLCYTPGQYLGPTPALCVNSLNAEVSSVLSILLPTLWRFRENPIHQFSRIPSWCRGSSKLIAKTQALGCVKIRDRSQTQDTNHGVPNSPVKH